jgi:hypothetical protein
MIGQLSRPSGRDRGNRRRVSAPCCGRLLPFPTFDSPVQDVVALVRCVAGRRVHLEDMLLAEFNQAAVKNLTPRGGVVIGQ